MTIETPPPALGGGGDPAARVRIPGYLIMGLGSLFAFGWVVNVLLSLVGMGMSATKVQGMDLLSGAMGTLVTIVLVIVSLVAAFGGLQMTRLKSYPMAVTGAVLIMLPCSGYCCCIIGLPVGIWALVVLMKPDVKAAFRP